MQQSIQAKPLVSVEEDSLFITAGGIPSTCFYSIPNESQQKGWVGLGSLYLPNKNAYKTADQDDWEVFSNKSSHQNNLVNGHYVLLKWTEDSISVQTDRLGLRSLYYGTKNGLLFLSTRIDWLFPYIDCEFDIRSFGSRWQCVNQISTASIVKGINRLVCGTSLSVNRATGKLQSVEAPTPATLITGTVENIDNPIQDFQEELLALLNASVNCGKTPSLALSGGLDSRVLLALLGTNTTEPLNCHTFGEEEHVDFVVARQLIDGFNNSIHWQLQRPMPSVDRCISELQDYVCQTFIGNSASLSLKLNHAFLLGENYASNWQFIDGAFGEIWRRSFLNRLALKGPKFIEGLVDGQKMMPFLANPKPAFFSEEWRDELTLGALQDVDTFLKSMPNVSEIGLENWLDLWAISTRLPNMYGFEQSRLDEIALTMMPFLQPSLLAKLWQMPVALRKNSKLFKQLIKLNQPELADFPLAKSTHVQPFFLGTISSRLWQKVVERIGHHSTTDSNRISYLKHIEEYVNDVIFSHQALKSGWYDVNYFEKLKFDFQSKSYKYAGATDWLVSVETFRIILQN